MNDATTTIGRTASNGVTRRGFALGLAVLLGTRLAPAASADKKTTKKILSVAQRARNAADFCSELGGVPTTSGRPGGTTVSCSGGANNGSVCTISSKKTRCFQAAVQPDGPLQPFEPANPWSPTSTHSIQDGEITAQSDLRNRAAKADRARRSK